MKETLSKKKLRAIRHGRPGKRTLFFKRKNFARNFKDRKRPAA